MGSCYSSAHLEQESNDGSERDTGLGNLHGHSTRGVGSSGGDARVRVGLGVRAVDGGRGGVSASDASVVDTALQGVGSSVVLGETVANSKVSTGSLALGGSGVDGVVAIAVGHDGVTVDVTSTATGLILGVEADVGAVASGVVAAAGGNVGMVSAASDRVARGGKGVAGVSAKVGAGGNALLTVTELGVGASASVGDGVTEVLASGTASVAERGSSGVTLLRV